VAKKASVPGGVCELLAADRQTEVLVRLPVAEVWGIGARWAGQLQALGIETALQLRDSDPAGCAPVSVWSCSGWCMNCVASPVCRCRM